MTIDKPKEPKIPDLPLGVSPQEILGDPRGRDGGGGGQRWMGDWSEGRTRSTSERRKLGAQQGEQRGSRSTEARRQMRDGTGRGTSRSNVERRQMRVESRRNERLSQERTIPGLSCGVSRETQGDPRGNRMSVAWRRIRDSHWRRTGEWLDSAETQVALNSSGGLRVAEPVEESPNLPWRPWEDSRPNSVQDQGLGEIVSQLQSSVVGFHKETVGRSIPHDDCPSSNLHHFVRPVPHTSHEVYPSVDIRTKKSIFKDLDDEKRFQLASKWVKEVNDLSWKKPGDKFTIISQPVEISGKHCFNCTLGGVCLGSNCLQKLVKSKPSSPVLLKRDGSEIPGLYFRQNQFQKTNCVKRLPRPLLKKAYPDPAFMKLFNWSVKKDPKGLKKVERLQAQREKTDDKSVRLTKKKGNQKIRKLSVLRSSPSRPRRGRRGRGTDSGSLSPRSDAAASSDRDLQSPPRRAPTVPGLSALLSPAASSPNADTPARRRARRKRALLRCRNRNRGCTDNVTFTTEDARNQHERFTCRALGQGSHQWIVPDHNALGLDETFCRVLDCAAEYERPSSRQRHEREEHNFLFRRNTTFAPFPVRSPSGSDVSTPPTSRPASPSLTPYSSPPRPPSPLSPSPVHRAQSAPVPLSSRGPSTRSSRRSSASSSDTSSMRSLPSLPSSPASQSQDNQHSTPDCVTCRLPVSHTCPFLVDNVLLERTLIEPATVLRPPKNRVEAKRILSGLPYNGQVNLCRTQGWCMSDVYPFCFMGFYRVGRHGVPPVFSQLTACRYPQTHEGLKEYLRIEHSIVLPKHIIIDDPERDIRLYLSPDILRPIEDSFSCEESPSYFTVTLRQTSSRGRHLDLDSDDDSDPDSDDDDDDLNNVGPVQSSGSSTSSSPSPAHPALQLIPGFQPGRDDLGEADTVTKKMNMFREPWKFGNRDILDLINMTKIQFLDIVMKQNGSQSRKSELNLLSEVFLWLLKLTKNLANEVLRGMFALNSVETVRQMFNRQNCYYYCNNINIPAIIAQDGSVNIQERDKLLQICYDGMSDYHRTLAAALADPRPEGRRRIGIIENVDSTYIDCEGGGDIETNKNLFYPGRSGYVVKFMNFTAMNGKIVAAIPCTTGSTPASGDKHVFQKFVGLEDESEYSESYLRVLLRGNDQFFVILVSDAGFVVKLRNSPVQIRQYASMTELCNQEGATHIHTYSGEYLLEKNADGKLEKVDFDVEQRTIVENTINWTRKKRMVQENIHASLKKTFSFVNGKKVKSSYLKPFSASDRRAYKFPESHKNMPKLSVITLNCASLLNEIHPGYKLLWLSAADQIPMAHNIIQRMDKENPLLYEEMWPINFSSTGARNGWTKVSIGYLEYENDVLGFPKLTEDEVKRIAPWLIGGIHALRKTQEMLTYITKLCYKDSNITSAQLLEKCQDFPWQFEVEYQELKTPEDFVPTAENPSWCPDWWDSDKFGEWYDCTIVKAVIPPSMKSATQRTNFHHVVIGFGEEHSARLGQIPPYSRIYFWKCFQCPSKMGSVGMDRHCATLLCMLSFPHTYRSKAKAPNLLNPTAPDRRQAFTILPPTDQSAVIPANIPRKIHITLSTDPFYDVIDTGPPSHPLYYTPTTTISSTTTSSSTSVALSTRTAAVPPLALRTSNAPAASGSGLASLGLGVSTSSPSSATTSMALPTLSADVAPLRTSPATAPAVSGSGLTPMSSSQLQSRGPTESLLIGYLGVIDQFGVYPIPPLSPNQPIQQFGLQHLQGPGLLNTGNICCHISIVLCFHRLGLLLNLEDDLIADHGNVLDWPALLMKRILQSFPSREAFSIQNFCTAWNSDGRAPQLQAWDDICVVDDIATQLPFRGLNNVPAFTRFILRYTCSACGFIENDCNERLFSTVPTLKLLPGSAAITAERLLLDTLRVPVQTRCGNSGCRQEVFASWKFQPGRATILSLVRNMPGHGIVTTRIIPRHPTGPAVGIMGELVSVVSRAGLDIQRGHFFSYHQVGGRWFKNDDDHPLVEINHHPFYQSSIGEDEDVVLLCYINNV